jgi:arginine exporter protein ArgO
MDAPQPPRFQFSLRTAIVIATGVSLLFYLHIGPKVPEYLLKVVDLFLVSATALIVARSVESRVLRMVVFASIMTAGGIAIMLWMHFRLLPSRP